MTRIFMPDRHTGGDSCESRQCWVQYRQTVRPTTRMQFVDHDGRRFHSVVPDCATDEDTDRLRSEVERIEILHRLRSRSAHGQPALEKLLDRVTAHGRSFFIW